MKRLTALLAIVAVGGSAFAVANVARFFSRPMIASKSVTAQYTASTWTFVDSIRNLQPGDSSASAYTVSGEAVLAPGQALYIGFGHTAATPTVCDLDTFILKDNPASPGVTKSRRVPFSYTYSRCDSVAYNDTLYCVAASSDSRPITLYQISLRSQTGMPYAFNKSTSKF